MVRAVLQVRQMGIGPFEMCNSGPLGLLGVRIRGFLGSWLSVLRQVLKGFLKGQDRFGDVVQAQAVGPVPLAGLILVADFNHDLGQRDLSTVVHDYVPENRGSDGAHLEGDFGF